ncbi:Uu.00g039060.m01.CDS01 [Anthostomella pinea]|uniref:Uu.00g039060.m01.CDS01 n=1 Tax=Anthostomella pinea TaxID=933095 RepID=A0AAI8V500_9PEZI|nr:Uu.00g039060.m01.CDS01 [Anthostomella pinea]
MLRPRLRIPRVGSLLRQQPLAFSRAAHYVPRLDQFHPEEGVPGLLSPQAYDIAWTKYMDHVIEKLGDLTAGTEYEQFDTKTILQNTAREAHLAPLFNYASMAHNNTLFFQNLLNLRAWEAQKQSEGGNPAEMTYKERIPGQLRNQLEQNFSSVETLRRELLSTALGMFGPGFVWLVKNDRSSEYRILTTYLAGTPYTAGHWRRQGVDMNTSSGDVDTVKGYHERQQTGAGADNGARFTRAPGGTDVIPVLCLNTWEHVWLPDNGFELGGVGGKRMYVEKWWDCIDWHKVNGLANGAGHDKFKS